MNRQELSTILKEHRAKNGVMLKRICHQMDTGESTVYRIERGTYNFNCDMWIAYMDAIYVAAQISHGNKKINISSATDIVEFIKTVRTENDMTQREFGKQCNISNVVIANIERGFTRVSIDVFLAIINAFEYELRILDKLDK